LAAAAIAASSAGLAAANSPRFFDIFDGFDKSFCFGAEAFIGAGFLAAEESGSLYNLLSTCI
jgi:hypothetical protein